MVISGKSVSRLVSRICFGNNGRNGRNSDAPAMLNMLPKLALVAMKTYFSVFANVVRPSRTPCTRTPRSFSSRTMSAASLATSTALSTEMPTSAACSAEASLMPSAHVADDVAGLLEREDDALFLVGLDFGEDVHVDHLVEQRAVAQLAQVRPGEDFCARQAHLLTDAGRDQAIVSGDDLQRNAQAFQAGDGLDDIGLGRIEKDQESQKRHAGFVGFADQRCGPHVLACDAERAKALAAELLEVLLDLFPHRGDIDDGSRSGFRRRTDGEHILQRALWSPSDGYRHGQPGCSIACAENHRESRRPCCSRTGRTGDGRGWLHRWGW